MHQLLARSSYRNFLLPLVRLESRRRHSPPLSLSPLSLKRMQRRCANGVCGAPVRRSSKAQPKLGGGGDWFDDTSEYTVSATDSLYTTSVSALQSFIRIAGSIQKAPGKRHSQAAILQSSSLGAHQERMRDKDQVGQPAGDRQRRRRRQGRRQADSRNLQRYAV